MCADAENLCLKLSEKISMNTERKLLLSHTPLILVALEVSGYSYAGTRLRLDKQPLKKHSCLICGAVGQCTYGRLELAGKTTACVWTLSTHVSAALVQ